MRERGEWEGEGRNGVRGGGRDGEQKVREMDRERVCFIFAFYKKKYHIGQIFRYT